MMDDFMSVEELWGCLLDYGFMRANLMMEVVVPSSLDEMFTVACHAMSLYEK